MPAPPMEATRNLLDQLWAKNKPIVGERLALLESAASQAAGMSAELRADAVEAAHKLAGSLGMYGLPQGTSIARELECQFESGCAAPEHLESLVVRLKAEVNSR